MNAKGPPLRFERLVSLARPVPRGGTGVHLPPLILAVAALAVAGVGAYRRWSQVAQADSNLLLVDRFAGIALVVGLVLFPLAAAGMLAARGVLPILCLLSVRGEARLVVTPYLWATRVRAADTLTVGIDTAKDGRDPGGHSKVWMRAGRREVSFPLGRSAPLPVLDVRRPDLVTLA
jgi:hypothetical protein